MSSNPGGSYKRSASIKLVKYGNPNSDRFNVMRRAHFVTTAASTVVPFDSPHMSSFETLTRIVWSLLKHNAWKSQCMLSVFHWLSRPLNRYETRVLELLNSCQQLQIDFGISSYLFAAERSSVASRAAIVIVSGLAGGRTDGNALGAN